MNTKNHKQIFFEPFEMDIKMATEKAEQLKTRILALLDKNRDGLSAAKVTKTLNGDINYSEKPISEKSTMRYLKQMEVKFEVESNTNGKPIIWRAAPIDERNQKQRALNSQNFALVAVGDMVSGLPPKAADVLKKLAKDAQGYLDKVIQIDGNDNQTTWPNRFKTYPNAFQLQPPDIDNPTLIDNVKEAVFTKRQMYISYMDREGNRIDIRNFHPLGHIHVGHTGYIVGYDGVSGSSKIKTYAVQRFIKADILPSNYRVEVPDGFNLEMFIEESGRANFIGGPKLAVQLRVWGWMIPILQESALSSDMRMEPPDANQDDVEGAVVSATVMNSWQFEHWILSCAEAVEVLEPALLREQVRKRVLGAAARYNATI